MSRGLSMFFTIGTPERLESIRAVIQLSEQTRRAFPILVVDDEPFALQQYLSQHGFAFTYHSDVQTVDVAQQFPIVVCDIKGVAKSFGSQNEGAHLVAEMRRKFPDKYLISYTGLQTNPRYNKDLKKADIVLSKDTSVDDWVEILDRAISVMADPVAHWLRLREHMLQSGEELSNVFRLEQAYIKSVKKRDPSIFVSEKSKLKLHRDSASALGDFAKEALPGLLGATVTAIVGA